MGILDNADELSCLALAVVCAKAATSTYVRSVRAADYKRDVAENGIALAKVYFRGVASAIEAADKATARAAEKEKNRLVTCQEPVVARPEVFSDGWRN